MRNRRHTTLETWQTTWVELQPHLHHRLYAGTKSQWLGFYVAEAKADAGGQHQSGQANCCGGGSWFCDKTTIVHICKSRLVVAECCVLANFLT
jgi:hypothetical protein